MDLKPFEIADDQQRWIVETLSVPQQLVVGGPEVVVLAFVLPGELATLPHISEAVAARHLRHALLEAVQKFHTVPSGPWTYRPGRCSGTGFWH